MFFINTSPGGMNIRYHLAGFICHRPTIQGNVSPRTQVGVLPEKKVGKTQYERIFINLHAFSD